MSFKSIDLGQDVATIQSSINEVVAISSSIFAADANIKFFKNIASASQADDLGGYWQSVYDASPTGSTSTALLDLTYGYATGSTYNVAATTTSSQNEKIKMYRYFANLLLGDPDSVFNVSGVDVKECFFGFLKRSTMKDEIKKGATSWTFDRGAAVYVTASDSSAPTSFKFERIGGDYANMVDSAGSDVAQIWYQAGVVVIPTSLVWSSGITWSGSKTLIELQYSGTINQLNDGLRSHMDRIDLHNQTNLYSTIYFLRATNNEFNYSSNPTFVDSNKRIRTTSGSNILTTRSYITTAGLYDVNDNMLGSGKVNKPLTKSPDNEHILRLRLDY